MHILFSQTSQSLQLLAQLLPGYWIRERVGWLQMAVLLGLWTISPLAPHLVIVVLSTKPLSRRLQMTLQGQ